MAAPRRIAIAIGDPNGIGPEIAVAAAERFADDPRIEPVLVGDHAVVARYATLPLVPLDTVRAPAGHLALDAVDALPADAFVPGLLDARAGAATVAYATRAVRLAQAGRVDAVLGCPHSETAIHRAGIAFSGYPGLVAQLTGLPPDRVFLMLVAAGLRIGHVTLHERLADALARLDARLVADAGLACVATLRGLGVARPSVAVMGINPHAGEGGLFGDDDTRVTQPAVALLREAGVDAHGPAGADTLLGARRHDLYLAMYHDQGHVPIKLLSPHRASAVAAGAPVAFSSVGHGCAHDIAGTGRADCSSVIETLRLLAGLDSGSQAHAVVPA